jgi:hypothetical protein
VKDAADIHVIGENSIENYTGGVRNNQAVEATLVYLFSQVGKGSEQGSYSLYWADGLFSCSRTQLGNIIDEAVQVVLGLGVPDDPHLDSDVLRLGRRESSLAIASSCVYSLPLLLIRSLRRISAS